MDLRNAQAPRAAARPDIRPVMGPDMGPDTLPACYRSEAFAEDLQDLIAPLPQWRAGVPQGQPQGVRDGCERGPLDVLRRRGMGSDGVPGRLGWQGA